jgi:RNA polymerase sigma-70 factor (ECF subfamily)
VKGILPKETAMIDVRIETVVKSMKGDKSAFASLVSERKNDIYRMAYSYTQNSDDAEDLFQDIVSRMYNAIRKLKQPVFFNTWTIRIVINAGMRFLRRRKSVTAREIQCFDADGTDVMADDGCETEDGIAENIDLLTAIEGLAGECKTIIILRYFQDMTFEQIAEILECPVSTVKYRHKRSLELLRDELSMNEGEGELQYE